MAGTYTQIHIQCVFAVKYRKAAIADEWKHELFGYLGATINRMGHTTLIVNGVHDHVHLFFGMRPKQALSDIMREVKSNSSKWLNESGKLSSRFEWQDGYGAFSYSKSQASSVITYIENQDKHHAKFTFRKEYMTLLEKFEIPYDERYIFDDLM